MRIWIGLGAGVIALGLVLGSPGTASATMPMQKEAKAAGFEAKNCLYCHVEKLPKKDAVTNNDRGKWLVAQKAERKAKKIDMAWLSDYVEPKKDK